MNINMTQTLTSLTGEPLEELEKYDNEKFVSTEETPDENPQHLRKRKITLRSVCIGALTGTLEADRTMKGPDKIKQFTLAVRIQEQEEVDLASEDVTLLKKRIGNMYTTLVVGRAFELLDPAEKDKD